MGTVNRRSLAGALTLALLWTAGAAFAQNAVDKNSWPQTPAPASRPFDPDPPASGLGLLENGPWVSVFPDDPEDKSSPSHSYCNLCDHARGFFAGAEFLLLRTHFSEADAYARVFQTLATPHDSRRSGRRASLRIRFVGARVCRLPSG